MKRCSDPAAVNKQGVFMSLFEDLGHWKEKGQEWRRFTSRFILLRESHHGGGVKYELLQCLVFWLN
jgi:hypothetical protein